MPPPAGVEGSTVAESGRQRGVRVRRWDDDRRPAYVLPATLNTRPTDFCTGQAPRTSGRSAPSPKEPPDVRADPRPHSPPRAVQIAARLADRGMEPTAGLEPATARLQVGCATSCATSAWGSGTQSVVPLGFPSLLSARPTSAATQPTCRPPAIGRRRQSGRFSGRAVVAREAAGPGGRAALASG